jgi:hypothetical protein
MEEIVMARLSEISPELLEQIPFLAKPFPKGSIVPPLNFFVGGEWHSWLAANGALHKILMRPVDGCYLGDRAERETDQRFLLLELLIQRTLGREMVRALHGLRSDFCGMAASLAKVRLFHRLSSEGAEVRWFVQTELEYLLMVARSVFDLLQEIVVAHWAAISVSGQRHKRQLPGSFGSVVLHEERPRTTQEIEDKYCLIAPLAQWYSAHTSLFLTLRALRDKIVHSGAEPADIIFTTDRGFAIPRREKPFCDLYDWPPECELPNQLVPLRPVLCTIVQSTRNACDGFAKVLTENIQLPPEAAPGLHYYSRSTHDNELSQIDAVLAKSLWDDS